MERSLVPPWVQVFADLNPREVQIIEMTNPIFTGRADQPIIERMHESVFLLRNGLTPDMKKRLEGVVEKTFFAYCRLPIAIAYCLLLRA